MDRLFKFLLTIIIGLQGPVFTTAAAIPPELPCRPRFTKLGNTCYHFGGKANVTWFKANEECQHLLTTLATLDTKEKNELLKNEITKYYNSFTHWMGLKRDGATYKWSSTRQNLTYADWDRGRNTYNEDCAVLAGKSNRWETTRCNSTTAGADMSYICEYTPRPDDADIVTDIVYGRFYSFHTLEKKNYSQAESACKSRRGYLVQMKTLEEVKGVKIYLNQTYFPSAKTLWIGLRSRTVEASKLEWWWVGGPGGDVKDEPISTHQIKPEHNSGPCAVTNTMKPTAVTIGTSCSEPRDGYICQYSHKPPF